MTIAPAESKKRRPRGTGSVRQRGAEVWACYWFTVDPATGKRRQHSKSGFGSYDEAQAHLNLILADVQRGTFVPDARLRVRPLLDQWLLQKESEGLKTNTLAQYRYGAELVAQTIGARAVGELSSSVAAGMVARLRDRGLSPRTIQVAALVLKSAAAWAASEGMVPLNPLRNFKKPRLAKGAGLMAWDRDQAKRFLAHVADDRLAAVWALLLARGLRRGELMGLKWSAVHLDARRPWLEVKDTRIVNAGKAVHSTPKAESERAVSLDAMLVNRLKQLRDCQEAEREIAADAYTVPSVADGYVVADALGRPMHPDSFSRRFDQLVADAGLPRITPHGLRHTCASLLLEDGVAPNVVAELLGDTVEMVLSTYAHTMPGVAESAGKELSSALLGNI